MSRAGLLSLFFFAFVGLNLVACAPVPERLSNLVKRYDDSASNLVTRALDTFEDPVYFKRDYFMELEGRDLALEFDQYFGRDYDFDFFDERDFDDLEPEFVKRETIVLERRNIFSKIKHAFQHAFHKIKEGFQKAGHAIKKGFQKVGHAFKKAGQAMKKGFQKVGHAIAHVAKKIAHGVVTAAKKVGHFIKTTGAKIAKFGLKIVAAAASVVSKVVKFIPGIGTAAGMALKGIAIGANKASDKIHANLGKLGKVDKALNNVINPLGSAVKHMGKGGKVLSALF